MKRGAKRASRSSSGEKLADHLLALRPQGLGALGIERIGAHAGEREAERVDDLGDVTILAIAPADPVQTAGAAPAGTDLYAIGFAPGSFATCAMISVSSRRASSSR